MASSKKSAYSKSSPSIKTQSIKSPLSDLSLELQISEKVTHPQSLINPNSKHHLQYLKDKIYSLEGRVLAQGARIVKMKQTLSIEIKNTKLWRETCFDREDELETLRQKMKESNKRHHEECQELQKELSWKQKKICMLEKTIEDNNENRKQSQQIHFDRIRRVEEERDGLERAIKRYKQDTEEMAINLQNAENTNLALKKENAELKRTPIPVVLPPRQPSQTGLQLYRWDHPSRSVAPEINLLRQRKQQSKQVNSFNRSNSRQRQQSCLPNSVQTSSNPTRRPNEWPYSISDEDIFWGR